MLRGCSTYLNWSWSRSTIINERLTEVTLRSRYLKRVSSIERGEVTTKEGLLIRERPGLLASYSVFFFICFQERKQHSATMSTDIPITRPNINSSAESAACCSEIRSKSLQQQPRRQWRLGHLALKWSPRSKSFHTSAGMFASQLGQQFATSFTMPKPIRCGL